MTDEPLSFAEFQDRATPRKHLPSGLLFPAVGLGGEAGEVLNEVKKIVRDEDAVWFVPRIHDDALLEEAGDVLFYLRLVLLERGLTVEDAARTLLRKLEGMGG
jgi:NTP pyrophosphatase (non-canonical NTP hydrolase)